MAKVMRPVYQCDMKGCQFISLEESGMTNVEFVEYDDEKGEFCLAKMLLCKEHFAEFQKIRRKINDVQEYSEEQNVQKEKQEESKKNVKKDLKKEVKRDNIYTNRTDVREKHSNTIAVNSEDDMQPYSAFYNVHEFHLSKNDKQLPGKYRVTIAPLAVEAESKGAEIVVLLETPDGNIILSSALEERKTVQYVDERNQINFTCRGSWENGFFRSKIYITSREDRSVHINMIKENIKTYHPVEYDPYYYESHYQTSTNDGELKLYIIPIMQKNYLNQSTKLLVVTETKLQRNALTDKEGMVSFAYDEKKYCISGSWQEKEFYADVSVI